MCQSSPVQAFRQQSAACCTAQLMASTRKKHTCEPDLLMPLTDTVSPYTHLNNRWAMMAVVGILGQEILGVPVKWYEAGAAEYDFPVIAQVPILFLVMGFLETKRFQGFKETGTVSVWEEDCFVSVICRLSHTHAHVHAFIIP